MVRLDIENQENLRTENLPLLLACVLSHLRCPLSHILPHDTLCHHGPEHARIAAGCSLPNPSHSLSFRVHHMILRLITE